ncbi:uncharacterized protein LOC122811894 [Protopterus annectens]|uniref:uncharacterized protein LOC122811894 n=1 Tax=Protopterus annectens TaxID=7888 RepID=UPI001CFA4B17|nr:uncharacterized protein LOC122811894 [Protopterus annectens]
MDHDRFPFLNSTNATEELPGHLYRMSPVEFGETGLRDNGSHTQDQIATQGNELDTNEWRLGPEQCISSDPDTEGLRLTDILWDSEEELEIYSEDEEENKQIGEDAELLEHAMNILGVPFPVIALRKAILTGLSEIPEGVTDHIIQYPCYTTDCGLGFPALCLASLLGNFAVVENLLHLDININHTVADEHGSDTGITALHCAAAGGYITIADLLLTEGADVNICTTAGVSPLYIAAEEQETDMVKFLLEHGASPKCSSIKLTSRFQNDLPQKTLRSQDGEVDLSYSFLNRCRFAGQSASIDSSDFTVCDDWTPLHHAAELNHSEILSLLLDAGACIDAGTALGDTPLSIASAASAANAVELLLSRGANVNCQVDMHALHMAAAYADPEVMCMLIQYGAHLNVQTKDGRTPLHYAIDKWNLCSVPKLLSAGADPNIQDSLGRSPLHCIFMFSFLESNERQPFPSDILMELIKHDAHVNLCDILGRTPLHFAVAIGQDNLVGLLLQNGASLVKDVSGNSPRDVAEMHGYIQIIQMLQEPFQHLVKVEMSSHSVMEPTDHSKENTANISTSVSPFNSGSSEPLLSLLPLSHSLAIPYLVPYDVCDKQSNVHSESDFKKKIRQSKFKDDVLEALHEEYSAGEFHFDTDCQEEKCQLVKQVMQFVQELSAQMAELDSRFSGSLIPSGSVFEGTKIGHPDELDFLYILERLEETNIETVERHKNLSDPYTYLKFKQGTGKEWESFATSEGFLSPLQLKKHISLLLMVAAQKVRKPKHLEFQVLCYCPAWKKCTACCPLIQSSGVGVCFTMEWKGEEFPNLHIDVDFVPAVRLQGWPKRASVIPKLVSEHQELYYCLVPKDPHIQNPMHSLDWRYSFSHIETRLFQKIPQRLLKCFRLLKILKELYVKNKAAESLNTYLLKTLFFHYVNNFTDYSFLEGKSLTYIILKVLQNMAAMGPVRSDLYSITVSGFFVEHCNLELQIRDETGKSAAFQIIKDLHFQ